MTLIFSFEFWLILGIVLSLFEIFTGAFISLAFGLSALFISLLLFYFPFFMLSWSMVLFIYGVTSLILSLTLWRIFRRDEQTMDIND